MRKILSAALAAISLTFAGEAVAECVCRCVNGTVAAICDRATEAAPVCAPRICPIAAPSNPPRLARLTPPPGTTHCFMAQVLNPSTGQYEWTDVCR